MNANTVTSLCMAVSGMRDPITETEPVALMAMAESLEGWAGIATVESEYMLACRLAARANRLRGIAKGRE